MSIDWGRLRRRADEQADLLTRAQCLTAGMTPDALRHRVDSQRWRRLHEGVFLTAPGRGDWAVAATAAFLLAQTADPVADAAWRGRTAGFLWGPETTPPRLVQLAVPQSRRVVVPHGVDLRRVSRWDELVHETAYPWRTRLEPTVLDIAADGDADAAVAIVARAVSGQLTVAAGLRTELGRRARHPHRALLVEVLADVDEGAQSPAEVRFVRDVERAHGLPVAERQVRTERGRARFHDNGYAAYRLLVEVDGRVGHESWGDRMRDGRRDRAVAGDGWLTVRVFWPDVAVQPCRTALELGALLRTRGWDGWPGACRRRGCPVRTTPRPEP
ncbi:MAG TPA: hypothetical protein VES95_13100 [Dermatophilaceae bacterium]|nr:hypothetical protein [Dermatophilaceae bacterium]